MSQSAFANYLPLVGTLPPWGFISYLKEIRYQPTDIPWVT
jgi:hypothetical protein